MEQLDDSIKHLVTDPKQEVLSNLKKRHGILSRSPSVDSTFTPKHHGSLTNVATFDQTLERASILDNSLQRQATASRSRSIGNLAASKKDPLSIENATKFLSNDQAELERVIKNMDSESDEQNRLAAAWPTMPEIKASLPIKGARKDSLQPLPSKNKAKKTKKKFSLASSLGLNYEPPLHTPDNTLSKPSKLPSIGKNLPDITVDSSPRQRRDPSKATRNSMQRPDVKDDYNSSDSSSLSAMVSFEGLERPSSEISDETFRDVQRDLDDVPDVLDDLPASTFDEIPTDVFDAIPAAVTAREEQRLKRATQQLESRRQQEKARKETERAEQLMEEQRRVEVDPTRPETPQRQEEQMQRSDGGGTMTVVIDPNVGQGQSSAVSLLTTLFPNAVAVRQDQDQMESDFMFALFIQEQEQSVSNAPNPRRDSVQEEESEAEELIGHFCAPFCPGFCEANFCIFHNPAHSAPPEEATNQG